MTAHKHAALMLQYAQDAAETDKPHERWEFRHISEQGKWKPFTSTHPIWLLDHEYRRKPRTMTYTVTVPEPLRKEPERGAEYWLAALDGIDFCVRFYWGGEPYEMRRLERGLLFATSEDAIAAARAMLPFKGEGV